MKKISAASDGTVFGLDADTQTFRYVGPPTSWELVHGNFDTISVRSATQIWASLRGRFWRWVGPNGGGDGGPWLSLKSTPAGLTSVSIAADGTIWGLTADGSIYRGGAR